MHSTKSNQSFLTVGWRVNRTGEPRYWLDPTARPGKQEPKDLVSMPAGSMGCHTAIIAQSGSGKSFFLGRLLEELVMHTRARCVVLDPNADFRRFHDVVDSDLWENAKYDRQRRLGKLPTESTRREFVEKWPAQDIEIRTLTPPGERFDNNYRSLKLSWTSLSIELVAEEIAPIMRSDLRHCHMFVQAVDSLLAVSVLLSLDEEHRAFNVITESEHLFERAKKTESVDFISDVEQSLGLVEALDVSRLRQIAPQAVRTLAAVFDAPLDVTRFAHLSTLIPKENVFRLALREQIDRLLTRLTRAPKHVLDDVKHYYFSKAREYEASGFLDTSIDSRLYHAQMEKPAVMTIIDLPSLGHPDAQLLVVNAVLNEEWKRARLLWNAALQSPPDADQRVPTFIVVDEAHRLMPASPRRAVDLAIREQFRTIIAEGRKYGLFLILASQRPDKLDPLIVSECENQAIMRLSTASVLDVTRKLLGMEDVPLKFLKQSLKLDKGRVLLTGSWTSDAPQLAYVAARRTIEGGRNLRGKHWASVPSLARDSAITDPETSAAPGSN